MIKIVINDKNKAPDALEQNYMLAVRNFASYFLPIRFYLIIDRTGHHHLASPPCITMLHHFTCRFRSKT